MSRLRNNLIVLFVVVLCSPLSGQVSSKDSVLVASLYCIDMNIINRDIDILQPELDSIVKRAVVVVGTDSLGEVILTEFTFGYEKPILKISKVFGDSDFSCHGLKDALRKTKSYEGCVIIRIYDFFKEDQFNRFTRQEQKEISQCYYVEEVANTVSKIIDKYDCVLHQSEAVITSGYPKY